MINAKFAAAGILALGFSAQAAFALSVPYSDNFNGISSNQLNTAPNGWISDNGTVDSIFKNNPYGLSCYNNSNGCVDLDGTTNHAGILETAGTFHLLAGHTYELSAEISGNQRGAGADNLEYGFISGTTSFVSTGSVSTVIPSSTSANFNLYTVFYTPTSNINVRAGFFNVGGTDDQGPILDNVRVAAVPLPASAWLLISGLAALGMFSRRRSTPSGTSALPA